MCSCQPVTNVMRSGLFFLPFFSSDCCPHQRNELVLLVCGVPSWHWQGRRGQSCAVEWCGHRDRAGLGSAECCPLPKAPLRRHLTFPRIETSAAHSAAGVEEGLVTLPCPEHEHPTLSLSPLRVLSMGVSTATKESVGFNSSWTLL